MYHYCLLVGLVLLFSLLVCHGGGGCCCCCFHRWRHAIHAFLFVCLFVASYVSGFGGKKGKGRGGRGKGWRFAGGSDVSNCFFLSIFSLYFFCMNSGSEDNDDGDDADDDDDDNDDDNGEYERSGGFPFLLWC